MGRRTKPYQRLYEKNEGRVRVLILQIEQQMRDLAALGAFAPYGLAFRPNSVVALKH